MKCPKCQAENDADAMFCNACGESLKPAPAPQPPPPPNDFSNLRTIDPSDTRKTPASGLLAPGSVFADRYEIVSLIGEGGMGVVYQAKDRTTEQTAALKLIRADKLAGKDAVKRLIREGVTTRDIRHPNVVAVYDVGEVAGQPYLSMEYLNGKTLRAWNRERMQSGVDCSMKTAANIVSEILSGLEAAHNAGVIHRDLTPENVMLMSEPGDAGARLKLMDFGIARAVGSGDTGATALGKLGYMAPEQMTAPDSAAASADLYSLSVMFYELLVSVVPQGAWQPPSQGRNDVPPGIDALIQKGLSNNPRARPQTVAEYREALAQALATKRQPQPQPPQPPVDDAKRTIVDNTAKRNKRNKTIWMWIGGGVAALVLLAWAAESGLLDDMGGGSRFADMNGYWTDSMGDTWSVNVSDAGTVSGAASMGPMAGTALSGQFAGNVFSFTMGNMYGAAQMSGQLHDCHIDFQFPNPNGYGYSQGQFHINHQPGAPCP